VKTLNCNALGIRAKSQNFSSLTRRPCRYQETKLSIRGNRAEFCTDPNSAQTHNVVATMPGDKAYSPLWLRVVYDSAACASVHNLETALQAKKVAANVLFINCPMVSVKHGS
jgi:hypothetical protein